MTGNRGPNDRKTEGIEAEARKEEAEGVAD